MPRAAIWSLLSMGAALVAFAVGQQDDYRRFVDPLGKGVGVGVGVESVIGRLDENSGSDSSKTASRDVRSPRPMAVPAERLAG